MNYAIKAALCAGAMFSSGMAAAKAPPTPVPAPNSPEAQIAALNWVHGPAEVSIGDQAKMKIPAGARFLDTAQTKRLLQLTGNPPAETDYTIASEKSGWFAVLEFDPAGYVSDSEKIEPDKLLSSLKESEVKANEERSALKLAALHLDGWSVTPHYDRTTHNLEWGTVMHNDAGYSIVNYTSRVLGRDGVMVVTLVSDPKNLTTDLSEFRVATAGFAYLPGKAYDAHQPGDKMAEYGLGALITGGAAAVAVKSGAAAGIFAIIAKFGLAFYKLIAVAVVGLIAAFKGTLKRLFGGGATDGQI